MILADTSVWIDHLRAGHLTLTQLLRRGTVLCHPWVIGELALGRLTRREEILGLLHGLPSATVATPGEVLGFIERHRLMATGIGYVDVQLLAATALSAATLWTSDNRLASVASSVGLGVAPQLLGEGTQ